MLRAASAAQVALIAIALVVALAAGEPLTAGRRYALLVPMALAMGVQNASAQRLAVPELTTTVLTRTLTGLASEARRSSAGRARKLGRRSSRWRRCCSARSPAGLLVLQVAVAAALARRGRDRRSRWRSPFTCSRAPTAAWTRA